MPTDKNPDFTTSASPTSPSPSPAPSANRENPNRLRAFLIASLVTLILLVAVSLVMVLSPARFVSTSESHASEIAGLEVNDIMAPETYFFDACYKVVYATQDLELKFDPEDACAVTVSVPKLTELTLTGTNGHKYWRVSHDGTAFYVDSALVTEDRASLEEKVREEKVAEVREQVTSANAAGVIVLGDSRTVGMELSVPSDAAFVCKGSMGYNWMVSSAIPQAEAMMDENTVCIFNFGVNDLGNAPRYVAALNDFKTRHPDNVVCFMSVNPVDEGKEAQYGYTVTNSAIASFNDTLRAGLSGVGYIDSYNHMLNNGFSTFDGLHYTANTYVSLYNYMLANIS